MDPDQTSPTGAVLSGSTLFVKVTSNEKQVLVFFLNIKLNPTFKSNVEYRISNSIQHSNRMLNIEYQTKSNIQIECRISNIKLNPTFKSNVEYRISN